MLAGGLLGTSSLKYNTNCRPSTPREKMSLPDEFEAEKLYENLKRVEDFRTFSHHIVNFLETHSEKRLTS
ncbi:hypothetical protein HKBW3S43_01902 [Candidatus Hakubella thermalkaliphila]|uniref:Uncharacterized protein n=2 Tax=Candidatus Hakubella thermalkaliphila TaxID=2754717 RepID=A0A6V8PU69_9ACTN|nr:hypothetical protein HKBW3S43_01902 [Candidatus Hakubella thermalkaliphila]